MVIRLSFESSFFWYICASFEAMVEIINNSLIRFPEIRRKLYSIFRAIHQENLIKVIGILKENWQSKEWNTSFNGCSMAKDLARSGISIANKEIPSKSIKLVCYDEQDQKKIYSYLKIMTS